MAASFFFAGCGEMDVSRPSGESTIPVETSEAPATSLPETVPPETEPLPDRGFSVTVDGTDLPGGSFLFDGSTYVNAGDFLDALDAGTSTGDHKSGFWLDWEGRRYGFLPGGENVLADQTAIALFDPVVTHREEIWLPLHEVCDMLNISLLEDPEQSRIYCTSGFPDPNIPAGIRVPVLMYHAVEAEPWGYEDLFVNPQDMESHLVYLLENGFDPIFFEDLDQADQYDKPVILTFDDGYLNNYQNLYPLLQKYQVKATIFVVTSSIGQYETSMTPEQVKELSDSGLVSIQSHTVHHQRLGTLDAETQEAEMLQSRLNVTRMTGREPFVISYPTGSYNADTLDLAADYYLFGVTVDSGDFITGSTCFTIRRYTVHRWSTVDDIAWMVCDAGKPG